jgi:hypothetical protein
LADYQPPPDDADLVFADAAAARLHTPITTLYNLSLTETGTLQPREDGKRHGHQRTTCAATAGNTFGHGNVPAAWSPAVVSTAGLVGIGRSASPTPWTWSQSAVGATAPGAAGFDVNIRTGHNDTIPKEDL